MIISGKVSASTLFNNIITTNKYRPEVYMDYSPHLLLFYMAEIASLLARMSFRKYIETGFHLHAAVLL